MVNVVFELAFVDYVIYFLSNALHAPVAADLAYDEFVELALAEG